MTQGTRYAEADEEQIRREITAVGDVTAPTATCRRVLLVDAPPCPLPAGHWPDRPHRAHSPRGDGRWVDFAEGADGSLVEVGRSEGL